MNNYESVIIVKPEISQEAKDKLIEEIRTLLVSFSKENVDKFKLDDKGVKKLAYEVNKHKDGHYYIFEFECNPEDIRELERVYRIKEDILKFITVRRDEE